MTYRYIDSVKWNQVLPKIIRNHNLLGEKVITNESEGINENGERRTVGSMPVLIQRYVGNLSQNNNSTNESLSKQSKKNKKQQIL